MTAATNPDVVLMDVRMPGTDGIEATRQIVTAAGITRVLILTTFDLDEYAYAGLRAGASGFLLKDVPPPELMSAIRSVASGDAVVAPRVTRRLLDAFLPHLPEPAGPAPVSLPPAIPAARSRLATFRGKRMTFLSAHGGRLPPFRASCAPRWNDAKAALE